MSAAAGIPVRQQRTASQWRALGVVCPHCHGALRDADGGGLVCDGCGTSFPVTCGIPDLRTAGDPYLTREEDAAAAERLTAAADAMDFAALHALYYEGNAKVPPAQVAQFTRGVLAASHRAGATLDVWDALGGTLPADAAVVDLGCGTAPLGVQLAMRGQPVLGVDAGLRWLVLARKRASDAGTDLPVICANAEALPLADGCVQAMTGESVLENLADLERALEEAHRVVAPGGSLRISTPNKHSLGPDPHLGVMAGGFWPEPKLRARAARDGKVFPIRRLLSGAALRRLLSDAGFERLRMALPRIAAEQRAGLPSTVNLAITGYHIARRTPILRALVLRVGPTMLCTAIRE
ncbi:MAG: methyltransferase domain-containing protein [Gemmatimonadaceae bacterium]